MWQWQKQAREQRPVCVWANAGLDKREVQVMVFLEWCSLVRSIQQFAVGSSWAGKSVLVDSALQLIWFLCEMLTGLLVELMEFVRFLVARSFVHSFDSLSLMIALMRAQKSSSYLHKAFFSIIMQEHHSNCPVRRTTCFLQAPACVHSSLTGKISTLYPS